MGKALTVTSADLEAFRRLMRFFFIESLKDSIDAKLERSDMVKKTLVDLDSHFSLEEPFVTVQIAMDQNEVNEGTLVVKDDIFNSYKNIAFYDIAGSYKSITTNPAEDKAILDMALSIQKRLVEVLDQAQEYNPNLETQMTQPQPQGKQYLN